MSGSTSPSSPTCKIVIKAANQKYEDFNVDVSESDWTIKQLKQHLSETYPSNPSCESIRLIYSGKLLHDHWTLKECLRQNLQTSHIIHIVLPASTSNNSTNSKAGSPGPRSANSSSADDHFNVLDDELTPGSSSNSDASTSSSDSSTPVQSSSASEFVNNPLNTFNQLQNNLNNLIQQQQRRQQQQAQQQYQQMSAKEQYQIIHANMLRYYESMGVVVQNNAWYSAYMQHLALYNYMYSNYLQSIGLVGGSSPTTATASATTTTQETQNERQAEDNQEQAPPQQPAQPAARPAPQVNQAALGGVAQDMGDREDDWLGILHNICSFLILFSIIYYYSSFERFVLIFSIVFILILYHKGWLTLQRRPAANANRRNAPAAPNRPAQDQAQAGVGGQGQQPENGEPDQAGADAQPAPAPDPVHPGTLRLVLTFVFTFFTSLVPERPQAAGN